MMASTTGTMQETNATPTSSTDLGAWIWWGVVIYLIGMFCRTAYDIRMMSIDEFGSVLHEFDPYFHYRATEYLYWNGWDRFTTWFDTMSWYPVGKTVGASIYPGLPMTAVWIKRHIMESAEEYLSGSWTIHDVCCYLPAWLSIFTSLVTGLISYEASLTVNSSSTLVDYVQDFLDGHVRQPLALKNDVSKVAINPPSSSRFAIHLPSPATECGLATLGMMTVVPAHLMRSVGGGFHQEAVAMLPLVATAYFWMRSLRVGDPYSQWYAVLAGITYGGVVATWEGGYLYLLNVIGLHADTLVLMGRYNTKVWAAYSLFFLVGTAVAIQIPVVGVWTPLQSVEHLSPLVVFAGFQLGYILEIIRHRYNLTRAQVWQLRLQVYGTLVLFSVPLMAYLTAQGHFDHLSWRARALFFARHSSTGSSKSGNPLIDSVAEHQPVSPKAYFRYLHHVCSLAPLGFVLLFFRLSESSSFLLVWSLTAYILSFQRLRLLVLLAPIGCILAGIVAGRLLAWCYRQIGQPLVQNWILPSSDNINDNTEEAVQQQQLQSQQYHFDDDLALLDEPPNSPTLDDHGIPPTPSSSSMNSPSTAPTPSQPTTTSGKKKKKKQNSSAATSSAAAVLLEEPTPNDDFYHYHQRPLAPEGVEFLQDSLNTALKTPEGVFFTRCTACLIVYSLSAMASWFVPYSYALARHLSHPTIVQKGRNREGHVVVIDDYRESYHWLRNNTPEDARIMAWWDYGFQITGIANRTTLCDGSAEWNQDHIALIGKTLTSSIHEGHDLARHLADYILLWTGGGTDDLAKSPHMARIANSAYRDHCPDDPTCRAFGFVDRDGTPSLMMERSLIYKLHSQGIKAGVDVPRDTFMEVYRSKYGKVRIWKILGVSKESKEWVAHPAHRRCEGPMGAWYCRGQYPPVLKTVLSSRKNDFVQLDAVQRGNYDLEHTNQYFADLRDPETARRKALEKAYRSRSSSNSGEDNPGPTVGREEQRIRAAVLYGNPQDTEQSTLMWDFIHRGDIQAIQSWLGEEPWWAFLRSADGRGPMWWAYEEKNDDIIQYLKGLGVPNDDRDSNGLTPPDLGHRL